MRRSASVKPDGLQGVAQRRRRLGEGRAGRLGQNMASRSQLLARQAIPRSSRTSCRLQGWSLAHHTASVDSPGAVVKAICSDGRWLRWRDRRCEIKAIVPAARAARGGLKRAAGFGRMSWFALGPWSADLLTALGYRVRGIFDAGYIRVSSERHVIASPILSEAASSVADGEGITSLRGRATDEMRPPRSPMLDQVVRRARRCREFGRRSANNGVGRGRCRKGCDDRTCATNSGLGLSLVTSTSLHGQPQREWRIASDDHWRRSTIQRSAGFPRRTLMADKRQTEDRSTKGERYHYVWDFAILSNYNHVLARARLDRSLHDLHRPARKQRSVWSSDPRLRRCTGSIGFARIIELRCTAALLVQILVH